MTVADLFVLAATGIAAGIVSTVAALASLVSYPVLLALGLPPLVANVTNTVSLCFTGVGAAAGSRPELAGQAGRVSRLGLVVALGGGTGAAILLLSPARTFEVVAPVLIGGASLVLLLQPSPAGAAPAGPPGPVPPAASPGGPAPATGLAGPADPSGPPVPSGPADPPGPANPPGPGDPPGPADPPGPPGLADPPGPPDPAGPATPAARARDRSKPRLATLFLVAVYVGYFGAAGGILLLAVLVPMLSQPLARTNAVKNVLTGVANGVAAVGFAAFGPVRWEAVLPLGAGFLIGGWIGPALVRRIPGRLLQVLIALAGLGLAVRLGLTTYH